MRVCPHCGVFARTAVTSRSVDQLAGIGLITSALPSPVDLSGLLHNSVYTGVPAGHTAFWSRTLEWGLGCSVTSLCA